MTAPAELNPAIPDGTDISMPRATAPATLSVRRINVMRAGYLFMAAGLIAVKWPLILSGEAASLPVFEGVVAALLGMMAVLAILGLRYPVRMLSLLVFECGWKLIWLAAVAVPNLAGDGMSDEMRDVFSNVLLVVVILAVTPWDYVWKEYLRAPGDPWR